MTTRFSQLAGMLVFALLAAVAAYAPAAQAQNKQPKPKAVEDAHKRATQAQNEAKDARKAYDKAVLAEKEAEEHRKSVRKAVEAEYEKDPALTAARQAYEQNKTAFEKLKGPLLEKLKQNADYEAALTAKEESRKKQDGKKFSSAIQEMKRLEKAIIDNDASAKAAQEREAESGLKVQALVKIRDDKLATDPRLGEAAAVIEKAIAARAAAKAKLDAAVKHATEAEKAARAEEQKHQPKPKPKTQTKKRR